ncbi:MAG: glycosyltransferase family 9 protein [Crocinitomicaceae bacterium]|nr:glycosyltransferase family 9 protein [Crocinitomicaceae bacterium]
MINKVLLIQTAFIGDVILATPIISELSRIYPTIQIDVLVRKGNEALLINQPNVNEIFTLNKKEIKIPQLFQFIKRFRKEKYDEIINLHRFASTGIITAFSGAKKTIGFNKNPFSFCYNISIKHSLYNQSHEVERNLMCIAHHNAKKIVKPELFPTESNYNKIKEYQSETYYCLAPSSVWFTKQLPIQKWVKLVNILDKKGTVYLLGGPDDCDLCNKIISNSSATKTINLAGNLSFLESAALMQSAERNYVNDSGPLHICSAMNAKVTAFFCSTTPKFGFGPLSDDSKIIENQENLSCKPCGIHGHKTCPKAHFKCGNEILINETI